MDDIDKELQIDELKMRAIEAELGRREAEVELAYQNYQRSEQESLAMSSASEPEVRRQLTPEEMKKCEEMMMKVGVFAAKTVATGTAVAGAGVVSLFKRDTTPIKKTFNWCVKNFWRNNDDNQAS